MQHQGSAEAGWYVDPLDVERGRYWDGSKWFDHVVARSPVRHLPDFPGAQPETTSFDETAWWQADSPAPAPVPATVPAAPRQQNVVESGSPPERVAPTPDPTGQATGPGSTSSAEERTRWNVWAWVGLVGVVLLAPTWARGTMFPWQWHWGQAHYLIVQIAGFALLVSPLAYGVAAWRPRVGEWFPPGFVVRAVNVHTYIDDLRYQRFLFLDLPYPVKIIGNVIAIALVLGAAIRAGRVERATPMASPVHQAGAAGEAVPTNGLGDRLAGMRPGGRLRGRGGRAWLRPRRSVPISERS